jgi:hypothetical protein
MVFYQYQRTTPPPGATRPAPAALATGATGSRIPQAMGRSPRPWDPKPAGTG